ncbi:MAG: hypoxanthine phosphoribosyltransferase [Methylacidiphilales bacterium]|nr:hypoxanthine phosphoribosyltransferase [Candidatus Methylacidiphilales bacterium]
MPIGRVLLTQAQIRKRVRELGHSLNRHYRGQQPIIIGVMNGALFFLADLLRAIDLGDAEISCLRLASYAGKKRTGQIRGLDALDQSVAGRPVLIVDDILDTGQTLVALVKRLKKLGASEIKTCVLLEKRRPRKVSHKPDWVGFRIANEFVVGYGLDYNSRYRTLRQIRVL